MDKNTNCHKEIEDVNLLKNCRKPEGELGTKMIKRMNKSHEQLAQWGVSHINISNEDMILDIGCGGGVNVKRFANMTNSNVYGLDYSSKSVEESKRYNQDEIDKGQVKIVQGSVSQLPFNNESFDLVTGFETVYFWPDFINDLKEVNRVLKSDGAIFICNEAVGEEDVLEKLEKHIEILGMNIYSEEYMGNALIKAGFKDIVTFRKEGTDWVCVLARKP